MVPEPFDVVYLDIKLYVEYLHVKIKRGKG